MQKVIVFMFKKFSFALFITLLCAIAAAAQEVEVNRYTVNARVDTAASAVEVRATLDVSNLSQAPKAKLYFRLTKLAKLSSAAVNSAPAQFEAADDRRVTGLSQVIVTPQASLSPGGKATVDISYRIEAPESTGLVTISPMEVLLMPDSVWVPSLVTGLSPTGSTAFSLTGAITAPFTLTVTNSSLRAASAGTSKGDAANQTFEQPINSLPFFVASTFDQPVTIDHGGVKLEIYAQTGTAVSAFSIGQASPERSPIPVLRSVAAQ